MTVPQTPETLAETDAWPHSSVRGRAGAFDLPTLLVIVVLIAGVAATGWGLWRHWDTLVIAWHPDGRVAVAWGMLAAAGWMALASLLRLPLKAMLLALPLLAAASAVGLGAVGALLLVLAAAAQTGLLVLPAGQARDRSPSLLFAVATAIGLALFAGLLQATGRLPLHYPLVYLALLATPFAAMPSHVRAAWHSLGDDLRASSHGPVNGWNLALWTLAVAGAVIRLLATFAPEAGMDALGMHLMMPTMLARDHAWTPESTGFTWAWMPMSVDWIYALAYVLDGEAAARLINFAADLLVLLICAGVARIAAGDRAAAMAAALYSTFPVTYLLTSTLFVENLWTLWLVAALLAMTGLRTRDAGWRPYAACGLLFGAALAAKVMTVFWAPLVRYFAYELWRKDRRHALRMLAVAATAALVVGGWPYAVAWWETGNPVYPFMNHIFQSPLSPAAEFKSPYQQPLDWRVLFDLTFQTSRYLEALPGSFGLAWLALLPAGLLAMMLRGERWGIAMVAVSLFVAAITLVMTSYVRYLAPLFPVWAVITAVGLQGARWRFWQGAIAAIATGCGAAGLLLFANSTWWYRALPPLGPVDSSAYREWQAIMRPEARLVDRANELGLREVLWVGRGFYTGLQARVTTNSWHQQSGWSGIRNADDFQKWLAAHRFDGIILAGGDPCTWVWLCEYTKKLGDPELASGGTKLFVIPEDRLYNTEKLKDPELTGAPPAWGGNGVWDKAAGVMQVNGTRLFSQAVPVAAARRYLYVVKVRCHTQSALFRMQVNFLAADGTIVTPLIETALCTNAWQEYRMPVTAPAGAATAIVYAVGQSTDRDVDVDSVSFRE